MAPRRKRNLLPLKRNSFSLAFVCDLIYQKSLIRIHLRLDDQPLKNQHYQVKGCLSKLRPPVQHRSSTMYQPSHSNHCFSPAGLWLSVFSPALLRDVAEGRLVVFVWVKSGVARKQEELMLSQTASKQKSSGN